ncbi:MAG: hypothetical protein BGO67_02730 [Alphaproteobacteria bacterium 41-28]|nr:MAG: hypothetical protein BGO67_02730 [Alphaproteobacteria bacterium 41-28]
MEENKVVFTEDIYSEHLATINNVKFTPREIDVMACLLSARRTSQIASMLSIAPRTVTTHFRNIMLRLDCNSQEGIINFIERSHKLSILREYYSRLVVELAFKKALKEISKLRREESSSCLIIYWQDQDVKNAFLRYLENHLSEAGISTKIQDQGFDQKIENIENLNHFFLLLIEKDGQREIPQEFSRFNFVDLSLQRNYYICVFEILKKLLSEKNLEGIFINFKEQYVGMRKSTGPYKTYNENDLEKERVNFNYTIKKIFNRKLKFISNRLNLVYIRLYLITLFCFALIGGIGFFILQKDKRKEQIQNHNLAQVQNQNQNQDKKDTQFVRSDLVIPAETVLLHRPELISQIDDKFKGQDGIQTLALIGPGGAGKTTVARQYAAQQKANVIWEVNAETHESLKSSFEDMAQALANTKEDKKILRGLKDINNPEEREEKNIQFVKERLKNHSNWILIFDNVEKFTDIQKYFPQDTARWGQGKIIIIIQDNNIENNKYVNNIVPIGELSSDQKLSLFTKIMEREHIESNISFRVEKIKALLEHIPPFPLDISVAAYFLKATNLPYETYLETLNRYNKDFISIQKNLLKEVEGYTRTRYGIIASSVQHLMKINANFCDLLLFICLLDSKKIPRDLLDQYKDKIIVEEFLSNLEKYSFILREKECQDPSLGPTFSLPKSTQTIILKVLTRDLKDKIKPIFQLLANSLDAYITRAIENRDFPRMKALISHCEKFLGYEGIFLDSIKSNIECKLGIMYYYERDYKVAEITIEKSLDNLKKAKKYPQVAFNLIYLGNIYRNLGNFKKAKSLLEQSVRIYKQQARNDEGFARALGYLGHLYRLLGNYKEAENLLKQSLQIYTKHLPENSIPIARTLTHLGITYRESGSYEKAKEFLERSLLIYKKKSEDQVGIAWTSAHLGLVYKDIGNYEKAKDLLEEHLEICRNYFPENHSYINWAQSHIGEVLISMGAYEEAKWLLERISNGTNFDKIGNNIGRVIMSLGIMYLMKDELVKAERLFHNALETLKKDKHPDLYKVLENFAELYLKKSKDSNDKKNIEQAKSYLKHALHIVKYSFPDDSPHIIRIESKLKKLEKH